MLMSSYHHQQQYYDSTSQRQQPMFASLAPPPTTLTTADMQRLRESFASRVVASAAAAARPNEAQALTYDDRYPTTHDHSRYDQRYHHDRESHVSHNGSYPQPTTVSGSLTYSEPSAVYDDASSSPARYAVHPMSQQQQGSWPLQQHPHEFQSSGPLFAAGSSSGDSNL
ncbi:hypothetical protein Gpo141_00014125, partial [Globisporangium polare]